MTQGSDVIHGWLGWCPNSPGVNTAPIVSPAPRVTLRNAAPQDPSGRSGRRIHAGAGIAADCIRTLFREKSLLWFSAGAGLVIAFMFLALYVLHILANYPYFMGDPYLPISEPVGFILTFCVEFMSTTVLLCLLTGLISGNLNPYGKFSIREKRSSTRQSLNRILLFAGILSLIVTAIFTLQIRYFPDITFGIWDLLTRFPFYFIILPEVYNYGPIGGGFHIISALATTVTLMSLNILFIVMTLFVVPALVLEKRSLREAVRESTSLLKRTGKETAACILVFFLILLALSATALIFPVIYHILKPEYLLFWYPGTEWIAAAYIWMAAWFILFAIGLTAAGIAVKKLYDTGKSGTVD